MIREKGNMNFVSLLQQDLRSNSHTASVLVCVQLVTSHFLLASIATHSPLLCLGSPAPQFVYVTAAPVVSCTYVSLASASVTSMCKVLNGQIATTSGSGAENFYDVSEKQPQKVPNKNG